MRNLVEMERLIESFSILDDGWDGYGAPKIPDSIIEKAIIIANGLLVIPDEIYPTPQKTIQLEYNKNEDNYLEVEIDERCIFFLERKNGIEREWVEYDEDCINLVLVDFLRV